MGSPVAVSGILVPPELAVACDGVEVKVRPRRGKSKAAELLGRVLQKLLPAPPK